MAGTRGTGLSPSGSSIIPSGGIVLVQYSAATTADGSAAAVAQVLTNTIDVPTTITGSGSINVAIRANGFNGNAELVVPVTVNSGDTGSDVVRFRINETLALNATFSAFFNAGRSANNCLLNFNDVAFNDPTAYFTVAPTTATGINASTSTITTDGALAGCSAQMPGSMIVTGIGAGEYFFVGYSDNDLNTSPCYNKDPNNTGGFGVANSLWKDAAGDGYWVIENDTGTGALNTSTDTSDSPSQATFVGSTVTASNITAGNSVIDLISWDDSAVSGLNPVPTFVGGGAGVLDLVIDPQYTGFGNVAIYKKNNVAGGETGVTYATVEAVRASMQGVEFSGLANAAATDTDTNSGTSATASLAGLSGDGLAVVIFAAANATNPFNEGTLTAGWTSLGVTGGNGVWQMSAYRIDGANAVSVGLTGSLDWASAGAVFAAA